MVELRKVSELDCAQLLEWRNLPQVSRYMYTDHQIDEGEHQDWFHAMLADPTRKYWIIVCEGKNVGLACVYDLDEQHGRCEWAFYIAETDLRGKGVGGFVEYFILRYVFEELKLHKLCCAVLTSNKTVAEMHMHYGFKQEGVFHRHIRKNGAWDDVISLAFFREDWPAAKESMEARLIDKGLL